MRYIDRQENISSLRAFLWFTSKQLWTFQFSNMFGKFGAKTAVWLFLLVFLSIFLLLFTTWGLGSSTKLFLIRDTLGGSENSKFTLRSFRKCERTLKVYMYNIPRKFNFGMMKQGPHQDLPWTDEQIPQWSVKSLKKQHNVEYWLMVNLLDSWERRKEKQAAVRVMDPAQADVFFMPFFSSLSFNTHGVNMTDPDTEKDRMLQVEVVKFLRNSPWWQRSEGRDHVLVMHHPNAYRFVREDINASIFIVADFGRFPRKVAWLGKDVVAPYTHVVESFEDDNSTDPFGSRTTLLYFRGRIRRKDDGVVRMKLARLLERHPGVIFEESMATAQGLELATTGMRSSKFCLHPAGDTPSSCRLFDAIVSHCVPVIISDKIELPFEDELNYREFCLFFSAQEALTPGYLIDVLENISKEQWLRMWQRLKLVVHLFEYQHPAKKDDAINMIWKQVYRKLPSIRLAIHRSKRLKIPDWLRH